MSGARYLRSLVVHDLESYSDPRVPLQLLYMAMTATNACWLAQHPEAPYLLKSGVVYARETALDGPAEVLRDIPSIMRDGWGDCDDLACWAAAELTVRGRIRAWPTMISGGTAARWHVVVRDSTGKIHDPSAALGMRDKRTAANGRRRTQHGITF